MLVQHDAYGVGKIMSVSGHGALKKVKIRFAKGGERTFIAEKAKLVIISKR
jgi:DNA helicase-2/ATP-dependent DNA helicase PcrA